MDNKALLSIIIPAYNCASTIERTVQSLVKQKSDDYEIIIVNDGSKDSTSEVCEKLKSEYPSVKLINKENTGVADTRNVGIKNSEGKYIAFLDSDDVWDEDYYDNDLNQKLTNGNVDIFVFSCCFADLDCNPTEYVRVKPETLSGGDYAAGLFYHSFCSFMFRREFLIKNNIVFPAFLKYGEDEVFRSKALYLADKIVAEDKMSFYYINNPYSSTKMNRNYKQYALQKLRAYYELKQFFFDQYRSKNEEVRVKNSITARYLTESLRLLPEVGYGYKKYKDLCRKENIKELLVQNGNGYFISDTAQGLINNYLRNPLKYYYKHRATGFVHNKLGDFKHFVMRRFHK